MLAAAALAVALLVAAGCGGEDAARPPETAAGPQALPANECVGQGQTDAERIEYARQFREQFGLKADEDWIREVESDPAARRQACEWGQSLTADEVEWLVEYDRLLGEFDALVEGYLARRPGARAAYAGRFGQGGDFHAGFTRAAHAHGERLARRFSAPNRLHVFEARWTLAELERRAARIENDLEELRAAGIDVTCVRTDVEGNGVLVGMAEPSDTAEAELRRRYGPSVRVEPCEPDT